MCPSDSLEVAKMMDAVFLAWLLPSVGKPKSCHVEKHLKQGIRENLWKKINFSLGNGNSEIILKLENIFCMHFMANTLSALVNVCSKSTLYTLCTPFSDKSFLFHIVKLLEQLLSFQLSLIFM